MDNLQSAGIHLQCYICFPFTLAAKCHSRQPSSIFAFSFHLKQLLHSSLDILFIYLPHLHFFLNVALPFSVQFLTCHSKSVVVLDLMKILWYILWHTPIYIHINKQMHMHILKKKTRPVKSSATLMYRNKEIEITIQNSIFKVFVCLQNTLHCRVPKLACLHIICSRISP